MPDLDSTTKLAFAGMALREIPWEVISGIGLSAALVLGAVALAALIDD
jgi:hypothetical protein